MESLKKIDDFFIEIKSISVAHRFQYRKSAVYKFLKGRKTYGIVHILSGEMQYDFTDGRSEIVRAGDTFFLKPNDAYKLQCFRACDHYTVNFMMDESSMEGMAAKVLLGEGLAIIRSGEKAVFREDMFLGLTELWKEKQPGYRMNAISLLYKILFDFIGKFNTGNADSSTLLLSAAKEYLETHWRENITLEELASMCHISVAYFRHLFVRTFGVAPIRYRDSIRLLYAKDYLMQKEYNIAQIANLCGFCDSNYFIRFFKKQTGITPGEYRASSI